MQTHGRIRSMTHGTFDTEGDKPFSIDNTQTKEEVEGNGSSNSADVNSKNKSKNINWKKDVLPAVSRQLEIFKSQGIAQPTLRSVFYALYSLKIIPNTKSAYQSLSRITARAREADQLPIDCFSDQSRQVIQDFDDVYRSPEDYVKLAFDHLANASLQYHEPIPRWHKQPHYVEVWIEKHSFVATFASILGDRDVLIVPSRGYSSVSFDNSNFERLCGYQEQGKEVHVCYFGIMKL
jgi:hypothetical protein